MRRLRVLLLFCAAAKLLAFTVATPNAGAESIRVARIACISCIAPATTASWSITNTSLFSGIGWPDYVDLIDVTLSFTSVTGGTRMWNVDVLPAVQPDGPFAGLDGRWQSPLFPFEDLNSFVALQFTATLADTILRRSEYRTFYADSGQVSATFLTFGPGAFAYNVNVDGTTVTMVPEPETGTLLALGFTVGYIAQHAHRGRKRSRA